MRTGLGAASTHAAHAVCPSVRLSVCPLGLAAAGVAGGAALASPAPRALSVASGGRDGKKMQVRRAGRSARGPASSRGGDRGRRERQGQDALAPLISRIRHPCHSPKPSPQACSRFPSRPEAAGEPGAVTPGLTSPGRALLLLCPLGPPQLPPQASPPTPSPVGKCQDLAGAGRHHGLHTDSTTDPGLSPTV
uniref:Uncharacterized protein n=1 Tax=Myotis myotis TaxID=51298 RepID=A0A7J7RLL1_MYOMY|nr:hypothetical protein mMyoMyo1_010271 [Myotis myotis]